MEFIITFLNHLVSAGTLTTASMVLINLFLSIYIVTKFRKALNDFTKLKENLEELNENLSKFYDEASDEFREISNQLISINKDIGFNSRMSELLIEKKEIK